MARRRFFVPEFHRGQAELRGEDAHHLTRVLRVEPGQFYEISDNRTVQLAEVVEAHKNRVLFELREPVPPRSPAVDVTLLCALVKFERFEWILEKATETGAARLIPVITDRSEKGLDRAAHKKRERWERILLESSQQSRRDHLPELSDPLPFAAALSQAAGLCLFLDELPEAQPLLSLVAVHEKAGRSVALLVGPEGGWTQRERDAAVAAGWQAASLGPQVLRSETAAGVSVSMVISAWDAALAGRNGSRAIATT
jgi:16S rRNA (uracil1498-N3)-methyltransferase